MTRPTSIVLATLLVLVGLLLVPSLPAGASRTRAVDPATINPALLALPGTALPPGATVTHSAVSDNTDADTSKTHSIHSQLYETWHRLSGYRMDFTYSVQGVYIEAGYLTSIFPTAADAQAAMDNATNDQSIIAYIGHPLPDPCTAGDVCKGFSGPNPDDGTQTALLALARRGPILIEASAQVPNDAFASVGKTMEQQVYTVANAEDGVVAQILTSQSTASVPPGTVAPIPTETPTATSPPPAPTAKPVTHKKKCKKGYKRVHGKCKKIKKK